MKEEKRFLPCGQGENICNCKSEKECGYIHIEKQAGKLIKFDPRQEIYKKILNRKMK